jgi:predicted transposase/invertase (TIGR01784 family)
MTIAEQFRQEGKIEGKIEASHTIAFNFMKLGISLEQISKATSLSIRELQDMKKKIH